jgi:hypothetical protein
VSTTPFFHYAIDLCITIPSLLGAIGACQAHRRSPPRCPPSRNAASSLHHPSGDPPPSETFLVDAPIHEDACSSHHVTSSLLSHRQQPRHCARSVRGDHDVGTHGAPVGTGSFWPWAGPACEALGQLSAHHCSFLCLFQITFIPSNILRNSFKLSNFVEIRINLRKIQTKFCWNNCE